MKKFIFLILLLTSLLSNAAGVGTLGNVGTITVAGSVLSRDGLIILKGYSLNANYSSLFKAGSSSAYTVTSGKTLRIVALEFIPSTAATGVLMLYGDNDVGFNGSSPTTPVFNFPTSSGASGVYSSTNGGTYSNESFRTDWTIPQSKIPAIETQGAGAGGAIITAYGYEE